MPPVRKASSSSASAVGSASVPGCDGNGNGNGGTAVAATSVRPKGRPRGFRRDRDCRTCKARNVKCDLNRPSCGICVAEGIACQGYATTVRWASNAFAPPLTPASSSSTGSGKSVTPVSASSFTASPSCGPSPSPSLSHSSVSSPPDFIFKAQHHQHNHHHHHQQQQQQQQLADTSRSHGIFNSGSAASYSPASTSITTAEPTPPPGSTTTTDSPPPEKFYNPRRTTAPLQVRQDQRAQLLSAALEDNPEDSNWTTHYLAYYEFFTKQFAEARRSITKERRYRPEGVTPGPDASYPLVDRDLGNVWQLLWQRLKGQIPHGPGDHHHTGSVELLTSHAAALAELNEAIRAGDILALYGVVTLSFLDVYEGPFIDCQWHMHGARALLQLHCHDAASLDALCAELAGLREAVSLLSWYDTMGFYFEQNRRNALVFPDWVREGMRDDFFQLVSCPRDSYMVYAAVVKARTAHRGRKEDDDDVVKMAAAEMDAQQKRHQRDLKLSMLAVQQILRTSFNLTGRHDDTLVLQDSFRYAAALIATETAHVGGFIDNETDDTLSTLADRVCDKILAGVPVTSGKYRHLACQVTILGHHARTPRHRQAVDGYWMRCDTLARPIYPNGRIHSGSEEHWTRILGKSTGA
ncbi:uncharacterized protein B0I36DRAFT_434582 [Microdochium trichocladiopsis]|uniref:Zn(2)-C6 fungal-type domain-containing protein n=1 Tax=Microdochium trichocladiopsis TaxID=1682393 RepID=A0A9P8XYW3_9PEZI|nr:uncharacterized protein B0I36DRAFT_434582 [Microdochium trichocladiopsis]KAH7025069.1 hypothetical protein B0I36DRAFT_434582 [Microdochium trichocladiopsis]